MKGNIDIPEGVTEIPAYAYSNCKSLVSIIFPTTLKSIGEHAFDSAIRLQHIALPVALTSIGEQAFAMCTSLTAVSYYFGVILGLDVFGGDTHAVMTVIPTN